jgi:hypothetical protein
LSGELSGAFRITQTGNDNFVLAFARLVPKSSNPSEHYGPGEDARTHTNPERSWSANYGDFFRNDSGSGQPVKREVIVVDLAVDASATITGSAAILPSVGQDTSIVTGPGAEAIDPVVSCNQEGDTAIIARVAQDPHFHFITPSLDTAGWVGTQVHSIDGGSVGSGCVADYLPIPYTTWPGIHRKQKWDEFHLNSHWRVYPWDTNLWVRPAGSSSWPVNQERVAEPNYIGTSFRHEDWTKMQNDLHDVQRRDGLLRIGYNLFVFFFNAGWHTTGPRADPKADVTDPHTWHPTTQPQLHLGNRQTVGSDQVVRLLASWNQFPRALRANFQNPTTALPNPAYEVRSLRLGYNITTDTLTFPSAYETFGSTTIRTTGPVPNRIGLSVQGAASSVLQPKHLGGSNWDDTGASRAFFQMGNTVFRADEAGAANPVDLLQGVVSRFRPPIAGAHGIRETLPNPHPPSTLQLAAWLRPSAIAGSTAQTIAFNWSLPHAGLEGFAEVMSGTTTHVVQDPRAEIVAVVPFVRINSQGWPVGRIVWKADDDVWWSDLRYQPSPATTLERVSSTTTTASGPFPTHTTSVSASRSIILWSHDGTVMAIRP